MLIYPVEGKYRQEDHIDVSVIVPLYKSPLVVSELIARWTQDWDIKAEVIFVDDRCPQGSKNAVMDAWAKRRDRHQFLPRLVVSDKNRGFGGACNYGAHFARGQNLVFLNADTVVTPNWLKPILDDLSDPSVGIVGNLHLKDGGEWHGTIDSAGSEWLWDQLNFLHIGRHCWKREVLERPFFPHEAPVEMMEPGDREMVTGCCFGIRADLFRYVGGFDHRYRIGYWEDSELCMTVRELGYRVVFQPESVIYHKLHHSGVGKHPAHIRNKIRFTRKWIDSKRLDALVGVPRTIAAPRHSNILVRRQAARGDVLVAAAIAPAIKARYPDAQVYFSTAEPCVEMLQGNPHLAGCQPDNLDFQEIIDLDLAYERRPDVNILQAYAEESGYPLADAKLHVDTDESLVPEGWYVAVHAGKTAWAGRNWREDRFADIVERLRGLGYLTVAVGHEGEGLAGCDVDLRGRTTIAQLAGVIKRSTLFIGIDSMPMHLAQAAGTPSVCFFGCIRPETRTIGDSITPVTACGLSCLGCHHRQPAPATALTSCPEGTEACIEQVGVEQFWQAVVQKLDGDE